MNRNFILKADILDIIFEKRNKSYGAYNLRKLYPSRLKLALGFMFIIAIAFSAFTLIPEKSDGIITRDGIPETIMTKVHEIPKEPEAKKPEEKKPEPKTETKPRETPVAQKQFTNNITIVDKTVKTDSIVTLLPDDKIGNTTVVTTTTSPFLVTPVKTEPGGGSDLNTPKTDITTPGDENTVDVLPAYPGGMEALRKFLEKNLRTPADLESGEMVSVKIKFVVGYNGKLQSFVTVQDGGDMYNKEVVRVLKKMPDWIPGKAKGENVPVYYTIPVKFVTTD